MATELTAEKLAQRALDVNVVSEKDLREVWSELGTRTVECEQLKQVLVRQGLLTNYQIDRLERGFKTGFFYGDYKVQYAVGAGTFARVYRAAHRKTNELVAVKVLRKRFSSDPEQTDMFRREGELGASLQHTNIVAIHQVYSKGGLHYIVMDFVEGNNLRDFFKVRGKSRVDIRTRSQAMARATPASRFENTFSSAEMLAKGTQARHTREQGKEDRLSFLSLAANGF